MNRVIPLSGELHIEDADLVILNDWPEFQVARPTNGRLVLLELEGWPWSWKRREATQPDLAYCAMPYGILQHPYDPADRDHSAEDDGWKWLPGACDPSCHPYLFCHRPFDLAMCATPYNFRPRLCQYLRERGFTVNEGFRNVADYAMAYNTAVATVDSGEGQEFLKWRIFEAAAMGCVVLHTGGKLMDRLFTHKQHYIRVDSHSGGDNGRIEPSFESVCETLRKMLPQVGVDRELDAIATAARHHVLQHHTYRHRALQILKDLGFE